MNSYVFLTTVAAVIGVFMRFRKFRSQQENREINSSSLSPSSSLTTTSSVAPSSSSQNYTHDIFPSFRGEDIRVDFLSHIQKEFQRKGIIPFIDNEIKRGEFIGPELIQAIRESKIAIILLSRNYASSKWCIGELVEIMNCREEFGQTVMVVFYKVDPSDVKKLTGDFGKIFRKTCEGKSKEDIKRWKEALAKVATIAGYHSRNWNNEATMIEKIATDISDELINSVPSNDFNSLIGMRAHMKNIEPFLSLDSDEVRMIGIWGPSGIGKSTIARFLFSEYTPQFQLCVFMENIKRRYPRPYYDEYSAKLQLHKEFLSQLISQENVKINHLGVAQSRLKNKRVFAVLDDVDHLVQLEAMAKETRWFGPGSRIIITTQDKKILKAYAINHIYEVGFPANKEALQIFCIHAFGQKTPYESFENLAWEATNLCGNLPLGLRVVGSYFRGMSVHEWKKELPRLRTSLDGEIESILKFSYDALLEEDKRLFLYIACFFKDEQIEKVEEHLTEDFVDVRQGLHVLAKKSLISIISGCIEMHDLLTRLGREIVRKQSIQDLGKRQFLLDARDICKVLGNDTISSRSVIGIDCELSEIEYELSKSDRAFEGMYGLQFLRIQNYWKDSRSRLFLPQSQYRPYMVYSQSHLPRKVKLLHWDCFPMQNLPSELNLEFLVELIMPFSKLEILWEGIQTIRNLKWMNLSYSKYLKELPNLSTATNLEELNISYCSSLMKLPSSIEKVINLIKLNLEHCICLAELSSSIGNAINLGKLNLVGCSSVVKLPSSIGNAIDLGRLNLSGCSSLVELPFSIGNAINLQTLNLMECSSLVELPSSIGNVINLKNLYLMHCSSLAKLPSSIGNAINLKNLYLMHCSSLVELPSSIENAINLKNLYLYGCSKLNALPTNINMKSLDILDLSHCSLLKSFPEISTNIRVLELSGTPIEEAPSPIGLWSRLEKLTMSYTENLGGFPHVIKFITELHLSDTGVQKISPWIKRMSRLHKLLITGCTKLVSLPELPDSLAILDAKNCESLERLDCSFHNTELGSLNFSNCFKLNQEARDLIMTTTYRMAVVPGKTMPTNFTYRAIGSSLSVTLNEIDMHLPGSLRFKVCFLLVYKGDNNLDVGDSGIDSKFLISMTPKGINDTIIYLQYLNEHLYTFDLEVSVSPSEFLLEFYVNEKEWEIGECGLYISSNT